jgi:hypothetical protein
MVADRKLFNAINSKPALVTPPRKKAGGRVLPE